MYTQSPHRLLRCSYSGDRLVISNVPDSNLSVAAAADQLPNTASLHVDICDPLLMISPRLDHCYRGFQTLVKDAHSSVPEACDKNVACNLIGRERRDT